MKITTVKDLGALIRKKRKKDKLTIHDAAGLCSVSYVFLSELENGKPTVQLDKVFQVLNCLGVELDATVRGWENVGVIGEIPAGGKVKKPSHKKLKETPRPSVLARKEKSDLATDANPLVQGRKGYDIVKLTKSNKKVKTEK